MTDNRVFKPVLKKSLVIAIISGAVVFWMVFSLLLGIAESQTVLAPWQVRSSIQAVEWAKCEWVGPPGANGKSSDCNGLEMYRFRLADGTITEPYLVFKAGPDFKLDTTKWRRIPIQ